MAERRGAAVYDLCLRSGWVGCEVSPTVLIGWDEGVVVGVVSVLVGIEKSSTTGASINLASAAIHSKTKWSDLFL